MSYADEHDSSRRDFLYVATGAAGAVTAGAAVWPLISQMNPSADVQALASVRVDVADVQVGSQITAMWQGKPVFIRRRTEAEITQAREVEMSALPDPMARNANIQGQVPATDQNRAFGESGEWLVMIGVCTHLGCVPLNDAGDYTGPDGAGGWFCPCHGSHYDTSGRIRRGPAPENLPIPTAEFVEESVIRLG